MRENGREVNGDDCLIVASKEKRQREGERVRQEVWVSASPVIVESVIGRELRGEVLPVNDCLFSKS